MAMATRFSTWQRRTFGDEGVLLVDYAFEEVGGLGCGLGFGGGREQVVLGVAVLGEDERAGALHEGSLRGVGLHGFEAEGEDGGYVEGVGPGGGNVAETAFDEEVGGEVEEALRGVELAEGGEAFGVAGPVEGCGGY